MPDNGPANATANAPAAANILSACRCRRSIFVYDVVVVIALLIVAVVYIRAAAKGGYWLAPPTKDEAALVEIALRALWFGALGGIVISLKGVYEHCSHRGEWDDCFDLWHLGRPLSGALTGLITLVLLLAINQDSRPNEAVVYAIAFIFGTQERRFFNFLSEVAGLVVRVPNEDQKTGLKAVDVQPDRGKEGDLVLISGQGFVQGATVTIGPNPLTNLVVAKDGTTIAGRVPAKPNGAAGALDVTIANPTGERVVLPSKFTYTA
jgi:hypothetical protein